jgi:predicted phosphoribosyltransferase
VRLVRWIPPLFDDRAAAGRVLAGAVAQHALKDAVVVGIARGGVAVALVVARTLGAPLTAVDVEPVHAGGRRLGATTADGPAYLRDVHEIPEHVVDVAVGRAREAAEALEARLQHRSLPIGERAALLVDDGLVSGVTLAAACRWARAAGAAQVVAATPVGHVDGLALLRGEADAIVCPHQLTEIAVVGQAYEAFDPLDEWYVAGLLADAG